MLNFFTAQNYLYAKLPAIATNGDFWGRKFAEFIAQMTNSFPFFIFVEILNNNVTNRV